jgi:DNA mismatch endonuclease (patch repair protein)
MARQRALVSPSASSPAVSAVMRGNKKRDTGPELIVRKLLHALGYRYRLQARDLPGNPDIVFPERQRVIFVHGCFWHQHQAARCPLTSHPRSNMHYWRPKLLRNRQRDRAHEREIAKMGWKSLVVWECELSKLGPVKRKLTLFLDAD